MAEMIIGTDQIVITLHNGQKFELPLTDFYFWVEKRRAQYETDGKTSLADCHQFYMEIQDKVAELAPGVVLTIGEADDLSSQIGIAYAKKKQKMRADLEESLKLASSMASGVET